MVLKNKIFKILSLTLISYTSFCIVVFFIVPPQYRRTEFVWWQEIFSITTRPFTGVFQHGKQSMPYNWSEVEVSDISAFVPALDLRSKETRYRDYKKWSYKNLVASFGVVEQTAIIEPNGYKDWWAVAFCIPEQGYCAESNLFFEGEVRIMVDGDTQVWGRTMDGRYFDLQLVEYSTVSQDREIPFV